MALWTLRESGIEKVVETTFADEGLLERGDLQRVLREHIDVIAPNTLVISEEYGEWSEGRRRIDLLGLDANANLVVIELKRNETGAHMDLQAVRYAAMVSTMTYARAVDTFRAHLKALGREDDADTTLLDFLGWDEPQEDEFARDVRIVLASAEFSKELTTSVIWLNERGLDIRCVRLKPYKLGEHLLLDVSQVIPLPEAEEYQVRVREKAEENRQARSYNVDFTRFDVKVAGETHLGLWKRGVIHTIVRAAILEGENPKEVNQSLPGNRERVLSLDGELTADEFLTQVVANASAAGKKFDARRYFLDDQELIRKDGRTHAVSNQWARESFLPAVDALRKRFPQLNIEVKPSGTDATEGETP